ncbi:MAG: riboflavin kinase [bacterium]|nr:riboflavin kinase [bacterium]
MNLAVGFFDGVHLGHRRILSRADAALTFRNHPATIYAPSRAPSLLMTSETRLAAIGSALAARAGERVGESVRALNFTAELAAQPPEVFADWLRTSYPGLEVLFCGANWTFGAGGRGDAEFLRARGFRVEVVPFAEYAGAPVSSTRVRAAVAAGNLASASAMLGCHWRLEGELASGKGVGRGLGYPTLNVHPAAGLVLPPCGVYAVETALGAGVANLGFAPTMGEQAWKRPILEVHLFAETVDFPASGSFLVGMKRFLRPERTFASLADLRAQIARDVIAARS